MNARWSEGSGSGEPLIDPVRGVELVRASSDGIDYAAALNYARTVGGPALHALTYAERSHLLGLRRILVPSSLRRVVADGIHARLSQIRVGDPRNATVQMGPLVSKQQQQSVRDGIQRLARESQVIFGHSDGFSPLGADPTVSAFVQPTLLANEALGHGNVMPMSIHGGPGRAGGGQELGGLRALRFYHRGRLPLAGCAPVSPVASGSAE
jgi:aldehyde dehydrogenase family protein